MISIIVPCYNENKVLPQLFTRLNQAADTWGMPWEVITVNDGSDDDTMRILRGFHARNKNWKIVSFSRNFGHQNAISAGLKYASGECAVIIDADLQDPPEIIGQFIEKWREGYDVVYAIRKKRKESLLKRCCYFIFYRLLGKVSNTNFPVDSGDFGLMDRNVIDTINAMPECNRFVRGLRTWVGFRQIGVPYERYARAAGKPQYTYRRLIKLAIDGILSFSTAPLRYMFYFGMIVAILSFAIGALTLLQRIFSPFFTKIGLAPVPGYATTVCGIFFLGGVQLICLGILGEYIGRIYDQVRKRPTWIVEETCGFETQKDLQLRE